MTIQNRDYNKDVQIDHNNLETEWLEQPSLYMYYSEAHADAIFERDEQKQRLELCHAELDEEFRNNWDSISENKMTEASVKAKILQDPRYKKQQKLLNRANRSVNILLSAKTAFEHKKKALENIVTMKVSNFWSEPKIKKDIRQEVQNQQRQQLKNSSRIRSRKRKSN